MDDLDNLRKRFSKITIHDWQHTHPFGLSCSSDKYYVELVNRIISKILDYRIYNPPFELYETIAISVAAYLEDLVNDFGVWNAFRNLYKTTYGTWLPFYDCEHKDYMPDNINIEDIRYIIWQCFARCGQNEGRTFSPYSEGVIKLADTIYDDVVDEYEKAPESRRIADYINKKIRSNDYIDIRNLSLWLNINNPLIAVPMMQEEVNAELKNIPPYIDRSMGEYMVECIYSWSDASGPLGISTCRYIAQMCRDRGLNDRAEMIDEIKVKSIQNYETVKFSRKEIILKDVFDREYTIDRRSLGKTNHDQDAKGYKAQLVFYNGLWNFNGISNILTASEIARSRTDKIVTHEMTPPMHDMLSRIIEKHDGQRVFYCKTMKDVSKITELPNADENMQPRHIDGTSIDNDELHDIVLLLSLEDGPKMLQECAPYFKIKGNRKFSVKKSRESGINVFFNGLPDDIAKYIQDNDLTPEISIFASQGEDVGHAIVHDNLRFLCGFYRTEKAYFDNDPDYEDFDDDDFDDND